MTPEALAALSLTRGTLIRVTWVDIQADSVANTNEAYLALRPTFTVFWSQKKCPKTGLACIVTTDTIDPDGPMHQGWTCIPLVVVIRIEVIRRPRKPRAKRAKEVKE